jgi:hypothetical protein
MLRDLFLGAGVSVSDAAQLRVYLVVKQCAKLDRVRLHQVVSPVAVVHFSERSGGGCEKQCAHASGQGKFQAMREGVGDGHRQRLKAMGCGGRGKLALLMSQGGGVGGPVPRDCIALMDGIVRRVAAAQVAATPEGMHVKAQALRAAGDCAAAAALLQQAVDLGHLPSRADLADMLIDGREGVAQDSKRAFELAEEGTRLGCHHCQGVKARCCALGAAYLGFSYETLPKRTSRVPSLDEADSPRSHVFTRCPSCRLPLKAKKFGPEEYILMCPSSSCLFPLDRPDLRTYMMTRDALICLIRTRRRLRALRAAAQSSPGGDSIANCCIGSSDSFSVSGDENFEPDIGALDLNWGRGWGGEGWEVEGGGEFFEEMWGKDSCDSIIPSPQAIMSLPAVRHVRHCRLLAC